MPVPAIAGNRGRGCRSGRIPGASPTQLRIHHHLQFRGGDALLVVGAALSATARSPPRCRPSKTAVTRPERLQRPTVSHAQPPADLQASPRSCLDRAGCGSAGIVAGKPSWRLWVIRITKTIRPLMHCCGMQWCEWSHPPPPPPVERSPSRPAKTRGFAVLAPMQCCVFGAETRGPTASP